MADLVTFTGLFADQTEDVILARWRDWANEGLDPLENPDEWVDTREGAHWWIMTTPGRREAARLYDLAGTEVPASAFPQFAWGPYLDLHAELRRLLRRAATAATGTVSFSAPDGTEILAGTIVGIDTGIDTDADSGPEFAVTVGGVTAGGGVDLPVAATEAGSASNVGPGAVSRLVTEVPGVTAVTNADAIAGGTDEEDDPPLQGRILESFVGGAVANQLYYRRLLLNQPGIGRVTVFPAASGPGTVTIVIATEDGDPVASDVLTAAQELVDPDGGAGAGEGQTGAVITVVTATTDNITIAAAPEFEAGYSLDGAGGTLARRDALTAALASYVDGVDTGDEIVLTRVIAAIVSLTGVHDVTGVTINGTAANHTVSASPPKVPTLVLPVSFS